jgi:hypothetical protein
VFVYVHQKTNHVETHAAPKVKHVLMDSAVIMFVETHAVQKVKHVLMDSAALVLALVPTQE